MGKYRGKNMHRKSHPKIYVWSHTEKAEIEYFQSCKNHFKMHLLMPKKYLCWEPWKLINKAIAWKQEEKISDIDGDQVWCVFDVDDFYKNNQKRIINAVKEAGKYNIKIAYSNECFELWILLHFAKQIVAIERRNIAPKINQYFKKNKLGKFEKNQNVFQILLPHQSKAIENAKKILPKYEKINWENMLSVNGNPSTTIHFLIEEINIMLRTTCAA